MYKNIFDTHAHYDDEAYAGRLDEVFKAQKDNGVALIINCGSDEASSLRSIALAERYDFVYAAVGVHPMEVEKLTDGWLARIEEMTRHPKVVAIGEIGLDYYYDIDHDREKEVFKAQLELANRLGMPVQIHDRDAHGDVLEIIGEYRPKGCIHRYSGSPEDARTITGKLGMSLGMGGALTYKNAKKEQQTVAETPLESLILETDCPFLAPAQFRGKVSYSDMISYVAEKIAELKGGVTPQQVLDLTLENGKRLFGIK